VENQAKPPVFLLDTMSFIFRAYHAMQRSRPMSTRGGLPTAAIYVFVNMIKKLRQDFSPLYFAAVFDVSGAVFRDERAKTMGPLLMVRPRVLGDLDIETDHKPRKVPINLDQTMQAVDEYTIELPEGYAVDELPDPVKLDLGFAAYQSEVEATGNTIRYKRTYSIREITLPPERYADVQKLAGAIATDEESSVVLKKK